jgi:SDR family mycofactocin-dependent oxidoreductase
MPNPRDPEADGADGFAGKVVLISGAARGQGRSHALRFAALGASVVAFDICEQIPGVPYAMSRPGDLDQTVAAAREAGGIIQGYQADVRRQDQLDDVVKAAVASFGGIDVAVANAAILTPRSQLWETTEQDFQTIIDVNLLGVWRTVKAAMPALIERRGSVVVTGSGAAVKGLPNVGPYVTTKHGLVGMVRVMAKEMAPRGVRVNAVLPGNANTPMFSNEWMRELYVPEEPEPSQEQFLARARAGIPMGIPYVEPSDVTEAVVWLASPAARYVTGVLLPVDGGSAIP